MLLLLHHQPIQRTSCGRNTVALREVSGRSAGDRDTSGPYTDLEATIDVCEGLAALRDTWIRARGDVMELTI